MRTSNLGPLIAVLSLSAFSFTDGQYLPYVTTKPTGIQKKGWCHPSS